MFVIDTLESLAEYRFWLLVKKKHVVKWVIGAVLSVIPHIYFSILDKLNEIGNEAQTSNRYISILSYSKDFSYRFHSPT